MSSRKLAPSLRSSDIVPLSRDHIIITENPLQSFEALIEERGEAKLRDPDCNPYQRAIIEARKEVVERNNIIKSENKVEICEGGQTTDQTEQHQAFSSAGAEKLAVRTKRKYISYEPKFS